MIVLTGGGTGGHLRIAQALKETFKSRHIDVSYVGGEYGQDRHWFDGDKDFYETLFIDVRGVVNKGLIGKIWQLSRMVRHALRLGWHFRKKGVKAVVGVGGYAAAPAVFAAILFRIPLYLHEQNATTGALNRLARPFAKGFFSAFESESPCQGYPIAQIFYEKARIRDEVKTIIILGGSLGARALNDLGIALAPKLHEQGIEIIHQTGERDYRRVKEAYSSLGIAFSKDLPHKMAKADFAISRSGASTLFELAVNGLPALFIPYPYAAKDHQYYNARYFVDQELAYCLREDAIDVDVVWEMCLKRYAHISSRLISVAPKGGTECIADEILKQH